MSDATGLGLVYGAKEWLEKRSEKQQALFDEWKDLSISHLVSCKEGTNIRQLASQLEKQSGDILPLTKMGLRSMNDFVYLMADDVDIKKLDVRYFVFIKEDMVPPQMQHIRDMVLGQNRAKTTKNKGGTIVRPTRAQTINCSVDELLKPWQYQSGIPLSFRPPASPSQGVQRASHSLSGTNLQTVSRKTGYTNFIPIPPSSPGTFGNKSRPATSSEFSGLSRPPTAAAAAASEDPWSSYVPEPKAQTSRLADVFTSDDTGRPAGWSDSDSDDSLVNLGFDYAPSSKTLPRRKEFKAPEPPAEAQTQAQTTEQSKATSATAAVKVGTDQSKATPATAAVKQGTDQSNVTPAMAAVKQGTDQSNATPATAETKDTEQSNVMPPSDEPCKLTLLPLRSPKKMSPVAAGALMLSDGGLKHLTCFGRGRFVRATPSNSTDGPLPRPMTALALTAGSWSTQGISGNSGKLAGVAASCQTSGIDKEVTLSERDIITGRLANMSAEATAKYMETLHKANTPKFPKDAKPPQGMTPAKVETKDANQLRATTAQISMVSPRDRLPPIPRTTTAVPNSGGLQASLRSRGRGRGVRPMTSMTHRP